MKELEDAVSAHTKGVPMATLLWTNKSLRNLESELFNKDYKASYREIGELLKMLGYGLQADKKTLTVKPPHPDRNRQFEYINKQCQKAHKKGLPVLSIDAKKKENIGNFKNNGKTYQKHGHPIEVPGRDFPIKGLGKATPFGIYNIFKTRDLLT